MSVSFESIGRVHLVHIDKNRLSTVYKVLNILKNLFNQKIMIVEEVKSILCVQTHFNEDRDTCFLSTLIVFQLLLNVRLRWIL